MRAMIIKSYGGLEVLHMAELPEPVPQQGETLVQVRAAAVNPADGKWRAGMFASFAPVGFPHVLGYDVAGEVAGGDGFAPGTRVFGMLDVHRKGGYAEYVAVAAHHLAVIPDDMDFATAAALPTAGLTGTQMVEEGLDVQPGARVLLTGAVGAVGSFALYAIKARGAHVVAAVRASQRDAALAQGADEVLALGEEDWTGAPFDHLVDTVGGEAVGRLCRQLRPGGRILTAATTPIAPVGPGQEPEFYAVTPDGAGARRLAEIVSAGLVCVSIAKVLPLEQAAEAQRHVEQGGTAGKVILTP